MNLVFKTLFLLTTFTSFFIVGKSQSVYISVYIKPPYSLNARNYIQEGNNVLITIRNGSGEIRNIYKIGITLKTLNTKLSIELKHDNTTSTSLSLAPGEVRTYTLNQLNLAKNDNNIIFRGYSIKQYMNNDPLPEGLYQLCFNAMVVGYENTPVSGCTVFPIRNYDPPIILNPKNKDTIHAFHPQNIVFNWTPSGVVGKTRYQLKLVDLNITPFNNPNDAFRNNSIPFFQQNDIVTTSFVYDNSKPNLIDNHLYALEIKAYDPLNIIVFKNNGHSKIITFIYSKQRLVVVDNTSELQ